MDSISSEQQKIKSENAQPFTNTKEYKIYTSEERNTKINVSRKDISYQKYLRDEKFPPDSKRDSHVHNCFVNSSPQVEKHISNEKRDKNLNLKSKNQKDDNLEQSILVPEDGCVYNELKYPNSDGSEGEKYSNKPRSKLEMECERNRNTGSTRQMCYEDQGYQTPKKIMYQNKLYEIANNSSYICTPIDNRGTVRINDLVVKDDHLILSCKPRTHNKQQNLYRKQNDEERANIDGYIHPSTEEELKGAHSCEVRSYRYRETPDPEPQHINQNDSALARGDTLDLRTSQFLQEHNPFENANPREKSEVERAMRCAKLSNKFKSWLWVLFFVNVILLIVGVTLMIHTLSYIISKNYINVVVDQTGFVVWVRVVMILSLCIVFVAVYGIMTSIDRGKMMILAYCIIAFILAMLILIFLVFLWIMFENMKDVEHVSMKSTLKMYRCHRYIRNAWDDLQETHKCCGIEDRRDWKYIPPSCCNATNHQQKLGCLSHFISSDKAFEDGCRSNLEHYFAIFFFIAAFLLLLGFLLLLLGILASSWLLGKYKKVVKCTEVYYISR